MNSSVYPLKGQVRHYAWGGSQYIPRLLERRPDGNPWAEYWLGDYPNDPAQVMVNNDWLALDELIQNDPALWLGSQHDNSQLSFLMKILDVGRPLSIQVHPNALQAKQGFARENAEGLSTNDPRRCFKDANSKPELALALSDFWLLYGFRTEHDCINQLARFPSLAPLAGMLNDRGLKPTFETAMTADSTTLFRWLAPVFDEVKRRPTSPDDPAHWIDRWRQLHTSHKSAAEAGVLGFLLMNLVHLRKGESIFQDANIMHAYLHGQCAEIMSNSDNVLRGGLTSKYVDIPQLIAHLDFSPVTSIATRPPEHISISLKHLMGPDTTTISGPSIVLVINGCAQIDGNTLRQGEAVYVRGDAEVTMSLENIAEVLVGS